MGGEPFLIDAVWKLLDRLIELGVASKIFVGLSTNGQQQSRPIQRYAPQFRGFNLSVSLDGYGSLNEYLRFGASWPRIVANLEFFRTTPGVTVAAVPTLQNANALTIVDLLRFLDDHDVPFIYNILTEPERLSPRNLPPEIRSESARRLREYLHGECREENRHVVVSYCEELERDPDEFDPGLFDEFMQFTNDLDRTRGQSFAAECPELADRLARSGIHWRFAGRYTDEIGPSVRRTE
jgi:glutamate-1-semialdehyde 2,1-aminomutase